MNAIEEIRQRHHPALDGDEPPQLCRCGEFWQTCDAAAAAAIALELWDAITLRMGNLHAIERELIGASEHIKSAVSSGLLAVAFVEGFPDE